MATCEPLQVQARRPLGVVLVPVGAPGGALGGDGLVAVVVDGEQSLDVLHVDLRHDVRESKGSGNLASSLY